MNFDRQLIKNKLKTITEDYTSKISDLVLEFNLTANRMMDALLNNADYSEDTDCLNGYKTLTQDYIKILSTQPTDYENKVTDKDGKESIQIVNVQANILLSTFNLYEKLANAEEKEDDKNLIYTMLLGGDISSIKYVDLTNKYGIFSYLFRDKDWKFEEII